VRAVDLIIDSHKELATMPQDFVGLSYESAAPCRSCILCCEQHEAGPCLSRAVSARGAGDARKVTSYAARMGDAMLAALVNKSANPVQVRLRGSAARATECWTLTAPSIDAKDGVRFAQTGIDERLVPAYAAVLWKLPLMRTRS
jgi:hypothetical protein